LIPETWREELGRMIRFALVGLLNTSIGLGTIYLLQNGFGLDYRIANTAGYTIGIINSFILNRTWTFKNRDKRLTRQGAIFLLVAGVCWGAQFLALIVIVEFFSVRKEYAQAIAMVIYTGFNYLGLRLFVFKTQQPEDEVRRDADERRNRP